jgi:thiamine biosynthesis lipoprotein
VYARLEELEQTFSDYRPRSEVMRLCDRAGRGPVPVSPELFDVLRVADCVHNATSGGFDPTVGALSALWRESRSRGVLPSAEAIAAARERCGWQHVKLDAARRTVEVTRPGVRIDLGGIAKGYSAMEAVKTLRGLGMPRAMVALAGDVAVGDAPPGERGWRVRVEVGKEGVVEEVGEEENPPPAPPTGRGESRAPPAPGLWEGTIACISTSGDRYQFVDVDGVRYSHILDPATGVGLTRRVAVCVVARDGALADAAATALSVRGRSAVAEVERLGVRVIALVQEE